MCPADSHTDHGTVFLPLRLTFDLASDSHIWEFCTPRQGHNPQERLPILFVINTGFPKQSSAEHSYREVVQ